jgi:hypothetical protein
MPLLHSITRPFDFLMPPVIILLGCVVGLYTFIHTILVERNPSLVFNFQHWSDQNSARLMKIFRPALVREAPHLVAHVAGEADGIVIDVGSVESLLWSKLGFTSISDWPNNLDPGQA